MPYHIQQYTSHTAFQWVKNHHHAIYVYSCKCLDFKSVAVSDTHLLSQVFDYDLASSANFTRYENWAFRLQSRSPITPCYNVCPSSYWYEKTFYSYHFLTISVRSTDHKQFFITSYLTTSLSNNFSVSTLHKTCR